MVDRVEPGIELLRGSVPLGKEEAVAMLERSLLNLRTCLDRLGQSREISLSHTALDTVSFNAATHIMKNDLGTTPGMRAVRRG